MADFVPVDHDPFNPTLIPVEHDPWAGGATGSWGGATGSWNDLNPAGLPDGGMAPLRAMVEEDPNQEYGQLLPASVDKTTGEWHYPVLPVAARDVVRGTADLMEGMRDPRSATARRLSPEAMGALMSIPAGVAGAGLEGGTVGMSGGAKAVAAGALDMSEAARMARAKEMGFKTLTPLYHGTTSEFTAFDPAVRGRTTQNQAAQQGFYVALDPEVANEFANWRPGNGGTGQPNLLPLLHRASKPGVIDLQGNEMNHEIAATLADAFDSGHDAVMLRNYTTPGGEKGKKILAIRDPAQLRSRFAAFDPAKIDSSDLLASGGSGLPGMFLLGQHQHVLMPVGHDPFAGQ